ncbi:MAG: lipocalin family protein [Pseudomonadota bacterium]
MMHRVVWLGLVALTACAAPVAPGDDGGVFETYRDTSVPMVAKADLDIEQYTGRWFEHARYPVFFERGCANVTATYGRLDADTISVTNVCRDLAGTETSNIVGFADVVGPGRLAVTFPSIPFGGGADYWVLWTDPGYQVAVVGAPNGRSGWVLARSQAPDPRIIEQAKSVMVRNGYQLDRLFTVPQGAAVR